MAEFLNRLQKALNTRYRLERELGRGGMAIVHLAEDLKHHRRVAIKVLKPELIPFLGAERFLREIQIAAQLAHPNILPLYDSGEADGLLYYVMPYVEGETLRDRLNREKQLPLEDAIRIAGQVADALAYAHSLGLIHRDIKPENILFQAGHAVVSDFGVARAIGQAGGEHLTDTGMAVGTVAYMSPEQASGAKDLDGRVDIYGLGCVLYEMLAGDPPYLTPSIPARPAQAGGGLRAVRETVPMALEQVVDKALARAPADRFATAAQFKEVLEGVLTGASVAARSAPRTAGGIRTVLRPRWLVAEDAPRVVKEVRFEDVAFEYREGQPVVRDFNVAVPGGSVVALVGRSGAGKTTVTDLVARFHDPTRGRILLNGSDIRDLRLGTYRTLLALVQQDVFLFDGSVRDNIAYGRHDATDAEVEDAARRANAEEFILKLPEKYETFIGERGVKLSGGQCQRLAIARAFLASPQILILDEATSNLDTESEQLIQASMATLLAGRTTFVIAHRLSTVRRADLILLMDEGQVIERGSHDDLMSAQGVYCHMVLRQMESHGQDGDEMLH